jgi:integrase
MAAEPGNLFDLVFVNVWGRPPPRTSNIRLLKRCCKRAGIRPLSINNLRHSFTSQHLIAGISPLQISHLMGHKDPSVILKVYSQWTDREESRAEVVLAGRIFGAEEEREALVSED